MSQAKSEIAAWYVSRGGDASGPFATEMVVAMLRKGQLQPLDLVFREGEAEWKPVAAFGELKSPSSSSPPRVAEPRTLAWIVLRTHKSTFLQEGPFETQTIIDGLEKGRFQFAQYAWHPGMSQWMRIGDLREFDRRSRSRDSKPHVPPPLPDPIAAVLLEDDSDAEAEEFHITLREHAKQELTPNPLESMQGLKFTHLGSTAIGGAAAESPEQKASRAMSLVVGGNLAGVPWEKDFSDGYAQSIEIIDDEHSGIHTPKAFDQEGSLSGFTRTPMPEGLVFEKRLENTPHPFVPSVLPPQPTDLWEKWGRQVAGIGMILLVIVFGWHLATKTNANLKVAPNIVKHIDQVAPPVINSIKKNPVSTGLEAVIQQPVVNTAEFSVIGVKLDRPDGQIVVQGAFAPNTPIEISFKGRLGQVLSSLSVRKTVSISRKNGELPSLRLKELGLPAGAYTVEVDAGGRKVKNEIFIGKRDAKFIDRLETHLRDVSFETQNQKKILFYAAQELDILARDLGQNYGQLRSKPELWSAFFARWNQRMALVDRSLSEVRKKKVNEQAYPEETTALLQSSSSLNDVAAQYNQAIGANRGLARDISSDALTELITELTRQKESIGEASARPTLRDP